MKSKMNIKNILVMAILVSTSLFFINMSLAANTAKVSVETAKLRDQANTDAKVLELISKDQEVEVLEKAGEWYKVKYNNITGYLRQDLITVNDEQNKNTTNTTEVKDTATENTETKEPNEQETDTKDTKLGKHKIAEDTKLKIVPTINATDIIEVKKDEEVNVTEILNGWLCVETQTTKGWIREEKIQKEETKPEKVEETTTPEQVPETVIKTLFVNTTTVNLRKEANTTSEIVTTLPVNTAVDVLKEENSWSKVKVSGKEGYISSSLLSTTKQETSRASEKPRTTETKNTTTKPKTETPTTVVPTSGNGSSVVSTAKQYIGCKYVYGGSSPNGFDCSGFTSYVLKQHGVSLNRTAAAQYRNGTAVSRSQLQPGDLVMFGKSGINHVGIYIGGGMMVHAANPSRGVTTDTINSGYYNNNYVGARRVI